MDYAKIKILLILSAAVMAAIPALFYINHRYQTVLVSVPKFPPHQQNKKATLLAGSLSPNTLPAIPEKLFLAVPFTPQAPTGNWDQLHNEACEEASAIMAQAYFNHDKSKSINLPAAYVETEISKLTKWQDDNFDYHLDTTAAETARVMEKVYGLQTKLLNGFTADRIKNELVQNHIVVISEYGRALGNPFYRQPGPVHHMLLIKGFDGDNFITNDSGTKRGLNYIYSFEAIYNAAADWSHSTNNIDLNQKIAIAVWK